MLRYSPEGVLIECGPVRDRAIQCTNVDQIEMVLWIDPVFRGIVDLEL